MNSATSPFGTKPKSRNVRFLVAIESIPDVTPDSFEDRFDPSRHPPIREFGRGSRRS